MTNYHPDQFLLHDYVAGDLPGAMALPLAVHLEYCTRCRGETRQLNRIGAQLFEQLDPVPVSDDALDKVLSCLDSTPNTAAVKVAPRVTPDGVPRVLHALIPNGLDALDWSRIGPLRSTRLRFGDPDREVALQHIRAGGRVLEHGHVGNEITVVLQGRFSDEDGSYGPGDFLVRGPNDVHRPVAARDCDCLCLAVLDAPIRFGGLLGSIINPFMRIHPR